MKKLAISILASSMFLPWFLLPSPVFAGEETGYCDVTFFLVDETGKYEGSVVVGFTNAATGLPDVPTLELSYANSYGSSIPFVYSVPFGKTYNLQFLFPEAKDIAVFSADGTPAPNSIVTNKPALALYLKIAYITAENTPAPEGAVSADSPQGVFDPQRIDDANKEGNAAFTEFINAMNPTALDPDWKGFYEKYKNGEKAVSSDYELYTGRPAQEYLDMNLYERFLIQETYMLLYNACISSISTKTFSSEKNFKTNVLTLPLYAMEIVQKDTQFEQDAYTKLMLWEYTFVKENGLPYNYITGVSDPTAVGVKEQESGIDIVLPNVPLSDTDDQIDFGLGDYAPKDTSVKGMVYSSLPTIIFLAAIAVAALVFFSWKRKKNIDEKEDV
jgi:hypothetical protein